MVKVYSFSLSVEMYVAFHWLGGENFSSRFMAILLVGITHNPAGIYVLNRKIVLANYSTFYLLHSFFFQLNFKNKQKTEDSNKVFNSVQESITETTKLTKKRPISKVKKTSKATTI